MTNLIALFVLLCMVSACSKTPDPVVNEKPDVQDIAGAYKFWREEIVYQCDDGQRIVDIAKTSQYRVERHEEQIQFHDQLFSVQPHYGFIDNNGLISVQRAVVSLNTESLLALTSTIKVRRDNAGNLYGEDIRFISYQGAACDGRGDVEMILIERFGDI